MIRRGTNSQQKLYRDATYKFCQFFVVILLDRETEYLRMFIGTFRVF